MTWKELQTYLQGKLVLIGLTFINKEEKLVEQYQTHGIVTELTDNGIIIFKRKDNSNFQIPYDTETIKKAEKGEYRERATGDTIKDPDFIVSWQIQIEDNENLEEIKKYGYIPA